MIHIELGKIILGATICLLGYFLFKHENKRFRKEDEKLKKGLSSSLEDKVFFHFVSGMRPDGRIFSIVIIIIGLLFINQGFWNLITLIQNK